MKNVQPFGFLPLIHRSHHRINEGLYSPITQTENDRTPIKPVPSPCLSFLQSFTFQPTYHAVCVHRAIGVSCIANETEDHRHLVTNSVNNKAENNDTDGKRPNTRPKKFLTLNRVKTEIFRPKPRIIH